MSLRPLIDKIPERTSGIDCSGMSRSERAYFVSRLYAEYRVPVVVITPSAKDAETYIEDLRFFSEKFKPPILNFPTYNILPFKYISYHNEIAAERICSLYRLIESDMPPIVVTTVSAVLQKIIPKQELCDYAELIMVNEAVDRDLLVKKLVAGGYLRSMIVEEPGDFSVRGGILDVFSTRYPDPVRIELLGETVESLRFFSALNQRTIRNIPEAVILPAREAILKKERLTLVTSRIRGKASELGIPVSLVRRLIDRIKTDGVFPGIEGLIPLIYPELDTFFDYIPESALFILSEPAELEAAAEQSYEQALKNYVDACNEPRLCVEPETLYLKWSEAKEILTLRKPLGIKMLPMAKGGPVNENDSQAVQFSITDNLAINLELKRRQEKGIFTPLVNWITRQRRSGCNTLLVCSTGPQVDRLQALLMPYGIQPIRVEGFPDVAQGSGRVWLCLGRVSSGFVWPGEALAVITEDEIFGAKHRVPKTTEQKVRTDLLEFEELKIKDLVVHNEHGIGRYEGLVKIKLNGVSNDFLKIIYQDDDKLYLPVDSMSVIQKYMGVEGIEPSLDKMGGKSWERVKAKVKRSAEKIAGELLELYAKRKVKKGHAYNDIGKDFLDFEAGFPYEETQDQLRAIEDVLNDMKKPVPMDRLVCGDVGYGKTEVALRASLMAVNDGKQAAVLVPTTVLAEQHFATFVGRFEAYPIKVQCLSRFRSAQEQRKIIHGLKTGEIDIVIGTHRLLQKDVRFRDLGLFVIDEEQRFGVNHKEKLKKIRSTVDVLALTATPIPRTLHLSLMGIRDISVIATPPEHRKSIITYLCELNDAVIAEAIRNELRRNGQIYFVHNNIHSIWAMAKHLQKLVPEVRLDVAHGRLDEDVLENVMFRFMNKEIDMLVCTTIIESGLDIPSANTILVNRADRFGLAQIYQLRGRVGRLDDQAYAYLFIPKESILGKDAQKRLKVLMEHSDLGSGFQIAMSDLKIRGGGTILGAAQSGHIAAVGYDMFLKLMENAMSELKGEPIQERLEPEINILMSAFIPQSYIPDIDQRLSAYRRLAKMTELSEITEFKAELIDRFGPLPVEVANLLLKIMLKVLAIKAGVKRLDLTGRQLLLGFSEVHQKNPLGILDLIAMQKKRFELTPDHVLKVRLSTSDTTGLVSQSKNLLKEIIQRVNS